MGTAANVDVVRRWIQAFNDGDMAAEAAARAPDFVAHVVGMPQPLDNASWLGFIGGFLTGFSDVRLEIEDIAAEGDRVAVRWTLHGVHTGPFMGIPPTGRTVRVAAMEFNRLAGDRVAEHWVQLDQLGLLQQLGAMPPAG